MTVGATQVAAESVDDRLDRVDAKLDEIAAELRQQRLEREPWRELAGELAPIAGEATALAISYLGSNGYDMSDVASLARAVLRDASVLEAWIEPLRSLAALADEVGPLATPAVTSLNDRLQQLDERGYFSFARQVAGVLDNVVTSFTDEDIKLLGDNIVLILQTVKQMTQPEVMGLLGRTALTIQHIETEAAAKAPSTLALVRQMRDPQVRRGLARLLATLQTIGAEPVAGQSLSDGSNTDRR
jgi:uncharacterized protein YjgD (DUF1641 family)